MGSTWATSPLRKYFALTQGCRVPSYKQVRIRGKLFSRSPQLLRRPGSQIFEVQAGEGQTSQAVGWDVEEVEEARQIYLNLRGEFDVLPNPLLQWRKQEPGHVGCVLDASISMAFRQDPWVHPLQISVYWSFRALYWPALKAITNTHGLVAQPYLRVAYRIQNRRGGTYL